MRHSALFVYWPVCCFAGMALLAGAGAFGQEEPLFPLAPITYSTTNAPVLNVVLLGAEASPQPVIGVAPEFVPGTQAEPPHVVVRGQQAGYKITDPVYVTPRTAVSWSWKKTQGGVCVIQFALRNPATNQTRYFGYAAGAWSEAPSADPTVEVLVSEALPTTWTRVERNLFEDMKRVLGWDDAQVTEFYLSPWDGEPGSFADCRIHRVSSMDAQAARRGQGLRALKALGTGSYTPSALKGYDDKHVDLFDTSFEECAPMRNSAANEWSAFGVDGDKDFNAMGRDLWVRYPLFELVFRLRDGEREITPDSLDSFRIGLVDNRLPAIWAGWQYDGLIYKVSVMTVPDEEIGNYDLYKLQVQNLTREERPSGLLAGLDGPPDLRLTEGVVRGLGDAPFLVAEPPQGAQLTLRDWGLCDKRAKAYAAGGGPTKTEDAIGRYRLGLDGVPVVYRLKAGADEKYCVYLAASQHAGGYYAPRPEQVGDQIFEYAVEGCPAQRLDGVEYLKQKEQPLCVRFDGARDGDGDGYIEVSSGVSSESKLRHSCLSVIYVFKDGIAVKSPEQVYSGALNKECVWHINVGATPEQAASNQQYDASDIGIARLNLLYSDRVAPRETKTYWLKVPPIHRREPVSMGYIGHAFRDVLPGEAVPPYPPERLDALRQSRPESAPG